ncbi:hypothetical protein M9H77_13485 [Catharanthus roseus]|uniref:Uncharacterized protein n=1 Tax=Catharanthus roseus TaxID=4058 RepID=A0ACC0BKJ5_CATRO|nr:hypothetical protein M9H77_13485 [Catharanthus roseus]
MEEQLQQTEQFRKSHVPPHNILWFFREQDVGYAVRVWTSEVLHFGVETTNCAESEHSVLKLRLSTCHGDLDTVYLNIDSVIESQIAEIKSSLEISKLKEKKSHRLHCSCELFARYQHVLPLHPEDVCIFWRKLEIGVDVPSIHERDMDSEMRDLTCLLEEISTDTISKVREVRRLMKDVISPVLPDDLRAPLITPPETVVMKGRRKTNTTKKDKSYWEHVSTRT